MNEKKRIRNLERRVRKLERRRVVRRRGVVRRGSRHLGLPELAVLWRWYVEAVENIVAEEPKPEAEAPDPDDIPTRPV